MHPSKRRELNERWEDRLAALGASPSTLWHRIYQFDPSIGKWVTVEARRPLSQEQMDDRVYQCAHWLIQYVKHNGPGVRNLILDGGAMRVPIPPPPSHKCYKMDWQRSRVRDICWMDAKSEKVKLYNGKAYGRSRSQLLRWLSSD